MQPFEIIKVRLANQSLINPIYKGIRDCFNRIYLEEGPSAFYKGTLSPLIGIGAQVALQFGTNQLVKGLMSKLHVGNFSPSGETSQLPLKFIFLSGVLTGVPSTILVSPIQLTRIKMQDLNNKKFKSSLDVGIQILKNHGLKGLYQGWCPTLWREVISLGIYFGSYQAFIRQLNPEKRVPPDIMASFFAGGLAGSLCWLFSYPIDYIKTIVQLDDLDKRKYRNSIQAAVLKYKEQGFKTFFKGLGITMLRAFPVNGIGFVTFEYFRSRLAKNDLI